MESEVVLCITLTAVYSLLFLSSLVQLLRILHAQHDVCSFQFGFLSLCTLWSGLRAFFFGEWFALPELLSLLLWWLPLDLQFSTFSLLLLFYASLRHRSRWPHSASQRRLYIAVLAAVNVAAPLLTSAWAVCSVLQSRGIGQLESLHHAYNACQLLALFGVLVHLGYKLHSSPHTNQLLASLLRPLFPLSLLTTLCLTVFLSRAILSALNSAGLYAIELGGDEGGWKRVSPVAFTLLALWEVAPTAAVLLFFHHIPHRRQRRERPTMLGLCGACWAAEETDSGEAVARMRSVAVGGDGESERSGSPHSASSRLSYSAADELEAELLQSNSLSSHSLAATHLALSPPPLQHSNTPHAPSPHPHVVHSSLPTQSAAATAPSASVALHQLSALSSHTSGAYLSPALRLLSVQPQLQRPGRGNRSPQPAAAALHPPFLSPAPASVSAPAFVFPALLSSPLSASPDCASLSASLLAVASPPSSAATYERAAGRWRLRRNGGAWRAADASSDAVNTAGPVRRAAVDDEDEYEFEYRASLDT